MKKSLIYRLFGVGKISSKLMTELEQEGLLFADEGLKGSVTFKNFRAPDKFFNWKRRSYVCIIALTAKRLVGASFNGYCFDVALTDERIKQMDFSIDEKGVLGVSFDAGLFRNDWSGKVEYRFKSNRAKEFIEALNKLIV